MRGNGNVLLTCWVFKTIPMKMGIQWNKTSDWHRNINEIATSFNHLLHSRFHSSQWQLLSGKGNCEGGGGAAPFTIPPSSSEPCHCEAARRRWGQRGNLIRNTWSPPASGGPRCLRRNGKVHLVQGNYPCLLIGIKQKTLFHFLTLVTKNEIRNQPYYLIDNQKWNP
jgi:hypothetical protein